MSRARGDGRAPAVEQRQAPADDGNDGILSSLGTAPELARDGQGVFRRVGRRCIDRWKWFVRWGLEHRELQGVESVGLDEIHWGKGKQADHFLTVIYQI